MFDTKILLVILVIALVVFGAKRVRTLGSDLGASIKGFKQAVEDDEPNEAPHRLAKKVDGATGAERRISS
jgi:sec-independent protein translocase protein TatA